MLGIPLVISLLLFFIHFTILINSGPGNAFVSRPFRRTLNVCMYTIIIESVCLFANTIFFAVSNF